MKSGDSIKDILRYWLPELISIALLVYIPPLFDLKLIASLGSTSTIGALGAANNFIHTLIKFAEALPVATMAVVGRHNGAKEYKKCGQDLGDAFWTTLIIGGTLFCALFMSAEYIYRLLDVPESMVMKGAPFLRFRSVGVLLAFVYMSFLGFIKGVKNTRIPMIINIVGIIIFLFFDYALILGKFGFPRLHMNGSALATVLQFSVMIVLAIIYILTNREYKKYFPRAFFMMFNAKGARRLLNLSWPIMVDKTSLSLAYLWLLKMIAPMGKYAIASMEIIKNLERAAFLPALAFAQVITFLVSNRLGAQDFAGARSNIRRVLLLAIGFVGVCLLVLCFNPDYFVSIFDTKRKFTDFAAPLLPFISSLVIFDLLQVVLAGALRGAGDVRTVMLGRVACFCLFLPLSYCITWMPLPMSESVRFVLIYSSFYVTNALMGFIFLRRIAGTKWQQKKLI